MPNVYASFVVYFPWEKSGGKILADSCLPPQKLSLSSRSHLPRLNFHYNCSFKYVQLIERSTNCSWKKSRIEKLRKNEIWFLPDSFFVPLRHLNRSFLSLFIRELWNPPLHRRIDFSSEINCAPYYCPRIMETRYRVTRPLSVLLGILRFDSPIHYALLRKHLRERECFKGDDASQARV